MEEWEGSDESGREGRGREGEVMSVQVSRTNKRTKLQKMIIIIINQKYLVPPYLFLVLPVFFITKKKKITERDRQDLHHVRVHSSTDEFSNRGL